jgi:phospholipid/cholesterol/gamma-HCH transport system permease protein
VTFPLQGRLTAYTVAPVWRAALDTLARHPDRPIIVDASRLEYIDDTGIALIFDLERRERPPGAEVQVRDLAPNLAALIQPYDPKDFAQPFEKPAPIGIIEQIGRASCPAGCSSAPASPAPWPSVPIS